MLRFWPALAMALALLIGDHRALAQVVERSAGAPVQTDAGLLSGVTLPSGVRAWLGVPFAAPPVRDLRWRDPRPHEAWAGVWNADRFAPECIQPLRGRSINHYFGEEATSEDCLYLNIWAPPEPAPAGKPYPVIAWIYGGAFNVGSASMANYSGAPLAAKGAVYVAIAYRVGPLGFLAHPDLTIEGKGHSGNYGLKDQIAGLRWIQRNIAGFGGDPAKVTVVGQSAGSMSISLLQSSPAARGLFHRVVGMSGSSFGDLMAPIPLAQAEQEGRALQQALGVTSIEALRDIPADRLISVAATVPRRPVVLDGQILQSLPAASFAAGQQNDVPVMIGFTRDESFRALGPVKTVADYTTVVRKAFPETASDILAQYPATTDQAARRAVLDLQRDASVGAQMADWAKAQTRYGKAPVYPFFFTRVHPYRSGVTFADHDPAQVGAYHTGDVPYWLGTLDSLNRFRVTRDWTAQDHALSDAMMAALLSFARTGQPGAGWPEFQAKCPKTRLLGDPGGTIDWPHYATLPLLKAATAPPPSAPLDRPRVRD
jgi:para-nitrobenzyl esterase